jgi:hypothetical protein
MPDDKHSRTTLPSWLSGPPGSQYGGHLPPPSEPDIGKLPLLPRDQRFPHLKPPRRSWRRTLRQKLSEST